MDVLRKMYQALPYRRLTSTSDTIHLVVCDASFTDVPNDTMKEFLIKNILLI